MSKMSKKVRFKVRFIAFLVAAFVALGIMAGCGAPAPAAGGGGGAAAPAPAPGGGAATADVPDGGLTGDLTIWSFTDEAERQALIFRGMHPGINVDFQMVGMDGGAYEEWVLTALAAGGATVPDIIYLEAGFVRAFVSGPFMQDLSDLLPLAHAIETYQFTIDNRFL